MGLFLRSLFAFVSAILASKLRLQQQTLSFLFSDFSFCMMEGISDPQTLVLVGKSDPRTLVLVGKTGIGKSATGNSIIGNNKFCLNRYSSCGTTTSKLETRVMEDGQMLNVVDTPALCDSDETIGKEIAGCIKIAGYGIHAFLLVYSLHNRFSDEDKAAIRILKNQFGNHICDYVILVFTGGDELEEDGKTLEDFLCECPQALKEVLSLCGNRVVLFDNRTKDETKKANQVHELLSLVNIVVQKNGGEPYTNETFTEMKKWARYLKEQTEEFRLFKETKAYPEQQILWRMEKLPVEQMNPMVEKFDQQLVEESLRYKRELSAELSALIRLGRGHVNFKKERGGG